jgi:hypothetical protein
MSEKVMENGMRGQTRVYQALAVSRHIRLVRNSLFEVGYGLVGVYGKLELELART